MKFLKSIIMTFISNILIFTLTLIISVIISRSFGPQGKGIIGLSSNVISFLSILLDLGIFASNTYFIGKYKKDINYIIGSNIIIMSSEMLFVLLLYFLNFAIYNPLFKGLSSDVLLLTLITIPISSLKSGFINILLGLREYKKYNFINIISQIINVTLLCLFILLFKSILYVLIANLITLIVIVIVLYNQIRKSKIRIRFSLNILKNMIIYGIKIQGSNLVQLLTYRLDVFIINYFLLIKDVGIYSIAVSLAETMWQIPGTVSTLVYSEVSNVDDKKVIKSMTNRLMRFAFIIILICSLVLALISKPLIEVLFGKQFIGAYSALLLLIPGICIFSISKVLASSIAGVGRVDINLKVSSLACVITVILDLLLIPKIGINGASIATSISYFVHSLLTLFYYTKLTESSIYEVIILNKTDLSMIRSKVTLFLKK